MSRAHNVMLMLFMVSFFVGRGEVQEVKHAPTVEQCRADQRLWLDKLENSALRPDYETLNAWSHEMFECKSVDRDNERFYRNVIHEINADQATRLGRL